MASFFDDQLVVVVEKVGQGGKNESGWTVLVKFVQIITKGGQSVYDSLQ
jgi:hypothetical protein